jgi:fucose permease
MSVRPSISNNTSARIATTAMFFVNGLGIGAWAVCIPGFKARLALSNAELSLTLLAMATGAVMSLPVAGLIGPLLGTGRSTRLSCAAFGIALFLPALTHHLGWLALAVFLVGATSGLLDVSMNAHATFVEKRWGTAIMSSFHAAYSAGGLAGAIMGALLLTAGVDWSMLLPLVGSATLATLLATWTLFGIGEVTERTAKLAWPGLVALPLCIAALLCMMCEGAMNDWSSVYLSSVMASGQALAAVGYASFSATMLIGRLVGDWVVRALSRETVVRLGSALAAVGLFMVGIAPGPWWSIVGFALVGIGLSNVVPALFSESGNLGIPPATGIAMTATAGYSGFLIGPPLVGGVATLSGLRTSMFTLGAAAATVAILASVMRPRRRPATTNVEVLTPVAKEPSRN